VKAPQAPANWPSHIREKHWQAFDPEVQAFLSDRDLETQRKFTEHGNRLKELEPYERLAAQHGALLSKYNLQPHQAFEYLLNAHAALESNPMGALLQLAQSYQIDLASVFGGEGSPLHGELSALKEKFGGAEKALAERTAELTKLKAENAELKQQIEQRKRADEAQRAAKVNVKSGVGYPPPRTMDDTLNELGRRYYG
jgi:hypothetical protein